jgi:hypothetical protein
MLGPDPAQHRHHGKRRPNEGVDQLSLPRARLTGDRHAASLVDLVGTHN